MPFIQCHVAAVLSYDQKRRLIREIVRATHEAIDSDPKIINVLINEHARTSMCISGRVEEGIAGSENTPPRVDQ